MLEIRSLRKRKIGVSLACIVAFLLVPYYTSILWIYTSPNIFKPDALSYPVAALWGTGLLGLCIIGLIGCPGILLGILLVIGTKKWLRWIQSESRGREVG